MTRTSDLVGALIIGGALLVVLGVAEAWSRFGHPRPECTRKLAHLGAGIVCLFFPYLVESWEVVMVMALLMSVLFSLGGRKMFLRSLHGVRRRTRGSEYYPLAIFLVFLFTRDQPWLYVSAVLVLGVGDAFAALIGARYGTFRYAVGDESKSLEGSLVFLVVAFLSMHLPMLLLTDVPRDMCVAAALLVAALVTVFEAVSPNGLDNLFVPIGVTILLQQTIAKPLPVVIEQNSTFFGLCAAIGVASWRVRPLDVSGSLVLILFTFGAWSLGSALWAWPALVGFAVFTLMHIAVAGSDVVASGIRMGPTARALAVPLLAVVAARATSRGDLFYPAYLAGIVLVLTFSTWKRLLRYTNVGGEHRLVWAAAATAGGCVVTLSIPWSLHAVTAASTFAILAVCVPLAAVHDAAIRRRSLAVSEWHVSSLLLTLAGVVAMALFQWGAERSGWGAE